jgi:site-specific DNA-methyltransferase (adenine-specific)
MELIQSISLQADCIEPLCMFMENQFNLAHVDPPYFSGPEKRGFYGKTISTTNIKRVFYDKTDTWEVPGDKYFNQLFRVSQNQIIWGANYFTFKDVQPFKTPRRNEIEQFIIENPIGWIIWDKCNGNTSFNDYELAWTSFNIPTYIYQFMWNGMMQGTSELNGNRMNGNRMNGNKSKNQKRIHPTEKPIPLYRFLNNKYCNRGDWILDTHLGSGSNRIACDDLELNFYGIEKNTIHFQNQEKRFNEYKSVQKLKFEY